LAYFEGSFKNHWRVLNEDLVDDKQALDQHLFHRLRWALSFVKTIHVTPVQNSSMKPSVIKDYSDICTTLRVTRRPTLWSSLDLVHISYPVLDSEFSSWGDTYLDFPYNSDIMITRIIATFHPRNLLIVFDDIDYNTDRVMDTLWEYREPSTLWELEADHVTVRNVSVQDQGIPFAKKSLTIEFSDQAGDSRGRTMQKREDMLKKWVRKSSPKLERLTVIGYGSGLDEIAYPTIRTSLVRAIKHFPAKVRDDFSFRIIPEKDDEGEVWNDWRSFIKKEGK
jgi:hypothetical protein